jgi:SAM-dependent methyltransferase
MGAALAGGTDLEGPEGGRVSLSDHAHRNREVWSGLADDYRERGRRNWTEREISWGIWDVPERDLAVLGDVAGKDVVELGCGTGYFSAWLARRGARPVGVDLSPEQLATARELQREHELEFPLVEASAEDVPLPAASFDLAVSEYGASIWADPYLWVPEAARLLRPGGELVFLANGLLLLLCWAPGAGPAGEELRRDYFDLHALHDPTDDSTTFGLPYGEWISLLRSNRLFVEDVVEVQPPEGADPGSWDFVTLDWARRWPSEEIWKARKGA